ncbi:hypothetical protein Cpir12675_003180 [Ceratocystis pirilliformis]|uniref:Uncharacterized protein n=1 Tax=Ceratocystis pirilliformis TaxID=259994 RepID=A0ABR3Z5Q8_9PEZI
MAQKAKKDMAKANISTLKNLHTLSAIFNGLFLALSLTLFKRSLVYYAVLSIPAFICQIVMEKTGRPTYDPATRALRSPGSDLSSSGLMDSMFDTIWVTWGCLVLVLIFGNGAWVVWSLVPAFALYKAYGLLSAGRALMGMGNPQSMGADMNDMAPTQSRKQRRKA